MEEIYFFLNVLNYFWKLKVAGTLSVCTYTCVCVHMHAHSNYAYAYLWYAHAYLEYRDNNLAPSRLTHLFPLRPTWVFPAPQR